MFRVYSCTNCMNIAFQQVEAKSDKMKCGVCGADIGDSPTHAYVETPTKAGWAISWRVFHRHEEDSSWQGRGLRSALMVFRAVEEEWKKAGKTPVPTREVMNRCTKDGMRPSGARESLEWLQRDGRLRIEGNLITDVLDSENEQS